MIFRVPRWLSDKRILLLMQILVQSLGWEDPLEEEMATHSSIFAWRSSWTEESVGYSSSGCKESEKTCQLSKHTCNYTLGYKCIDLHIIYHKDAEVPKNFRRIFRILAPIKNLLVSLSKLLWDYIRNL